MPHVVEALWNASALDIERTIRSVCFKVLHDFSVAAKKRAARAEALARLGKTFQAADSEEGSRTDPMAGLEEAMRKAFERNSPGGEAGGAGDGDDE